MSTLFLIFSKKVFALTGERNYATIEEETQAEGYGVKERDRLALQNAGRWKTLAWETLLFLALALIGQTAAGIVQGIALTVYRIAGCDARPALIPIALYATLPTTIGVLLFCRFVRGLDPGRIVGPRRRAWEYAVSAPLGTGLLAGAVGICTAAGALRLTAAETFPVGVWLVYLGGFLLQGAGEEILCRGYFQSVLLRSQKPWVAVAVNSAGFALLHLPNAGVTPLGICNTFLFGVLASLITLRSGDLWGACAVHSFWNFAQGNLFGVPVSGISGGPSPIVAVPDPGATLWNGGGYGLEGGLAVTLCLTVGIAALCLLPRRNRLFRSETGEM